jgi:hypothetical protein
LVVCEPGEVSSSITRKARSVNRQRREPIEDCRLQSNPLIGI